MRLATKLLVMGALRSRLVAESEPEETPAYLAGDVDPETVLRAYEAIGAASYEASLVNLANPGTGDAAEGSAPTWDAATGWTFDGVDDCLLTGANFEEGHTLIVRYADADPDSATVQHSRTEDSRLRLQTGDEDESREYLLGGGEIYLDGAGVVTGGVLALAGRKVFLDGVLEGEFTEDADITGTPLPLVIGARYLDDEGVPDYRPLPITVGAWYLYDATLTDGQVAAISAAMAEL